jgi:hypothetical protein
MQKQIKQNCKDPGGKLPKIFEEYLIHYTEFKKISSLQTQRIKRILVIGQ